MKIVWSRFEEETLRHRLPNFPSLINIPITDGDGGKWFEQSFIENHRKLKTKIHCYQLFTEVSLTIYRRRSWYKYSIANRLGRGILRGIVTSEKSWLLSTVANRKHFRKRWWPLIDVFTFVAYAVRIPIKSFSRCRLWVQHNKIK